MKKITALLLTALMLFVPAIGMNVSEENTTEVWKNPELPGSFDTFYLQYEDGERSMMDLYGVRDGSAQDALSAYPVYVENELAIKLRGWTGTLNSAQIEAYGYRINNTKPVYNAEFKQGAEQAVYNAGGDSRYEVVVPIAGKKAPALITVMYRDVNGAECDILEFSINGNYDGSKRVYVSADGSGKNIKAGSGDTVDIRINVENLQQLKQFNATVSWPEELYLIDAKYGLEGGTVNVPYEGWESLSGSFDFCWSDNSAPVNGDFTFVTLTFQVNGLVSARSFLPIEIQIERGDILAADGGGVDFEIINGGINASPAFKGDVNCDGEINNKDVVVLFRHVSGTKIRMFSAVAADFNSDGEIDNKDVVALFRYTLDPQIIPTDPSNKPEVLGISEIGGRYLLYGTAEPNSVIRTVSGGKEMKNACNDKYFYIEVEGTYGETALLYATAPGKLESEEVRVKINPTASGGNVWGGRNSRIFYSGTYGFLTGNEADTGSLAGLKGYIINQTIKKIQEATGKKTKLIYAIIPDPATAYYDEQMDYVPVPNPLNTAMQSFVSEIDRCHEDVYALDLLSVMREHKNDRIYFTTDTHYTEFGAYYVYRNIMERVRETYPDARVRTIEDGDYTVEYYDIPGGDMCSMVGMSMNEMVPFFIANFKDTGTYYNSKREDGIKSAGFGPRGWQSDSSLSNSNNPTAYFLGDSYGCYILPFIGANFSKVWTNPGVLWSYSLDKSILEQNKPDYVILLVCQRNVGPYFMSNLVQEFSMSVSGF